MYTQNQKNLNSLLSDPVLNSTNILNEIMRRFPSAISFAPGAPFAGFFRNLDVSSYIDRYINYLEQEKGLSLAQARQLLYQYGSSQGLINELIAKSLSIDEGINVDPKAIVVTVGCQEAMLLILRALCESPRDILVVVQPCFVGMIGAARFINMEIQAINEAEGGFDIDQLIAICQSARLEGKRIKALYVVPDFSNPSGMTLDIETRYKLLEIAAKEDFMVLEDNAYGFTAASGYSLPTLKSLDKNSRVIYLGTFSKMCLPGTRVGFVVADQLVLGLSGNTRFLAEELAAIKSIVTVNTSPICQAIIGGMLLEHNSSLIAMSREKSLLYQRNLKLLLEALKRYLITESNFPYRVSWNIPKGGFFLRMKLPIIANQELLNIAASEYGVLWVPMASFYINDVESDEIRLSCSYLTPEEIDEGVRRLALFLQDSRVHKLDI